MRFKLKFLDIFLFLFKPTHHLIECMCALDFRRNYHCCLVFRLNVLGALRVRHPLSYFSFAPLQKISGVCSPVFAIVGFSPFSYAGFTEFYMLLALENFLLDPFTGLLVLSFNIRFEVLS